LYALLFTLFTFLQPDPSGGAAPATAPTGGGGGGGGLAGGLSQLALPVLLMVFLYLFLVRPQQKRQKELDGVLKQLKKGDKVRTTGGIRGTIIDFKSESGDEIVLLVDERNNTKFNVLRSHVAGLAEKASAAAAEQPKS
jgi:preprotein translocase subunit YajC